MREAVVLLAGPCRCLDVVQRTARLPPTRLASHLCEFGILNHHGVDDGQEGFIAGEETGSTSEGVTLHHALHGVLGQNLDDSTTLSSAGNVPLEVAPRIVKHGIQLVRHKLVWGKDAESLRIAGPESTIFLSE